MFVGASASCAIDDVSSTQLTDLLTQYPDEFRCRHADALLLIQVTVFSCGRFAVGVAWNHALADAAGMGQFLQAVGELARGVSPPSVVPVRSDDLVLAAHRRGLGANSISNVEITKDLALLDLTIPWSLINRVKAEVSSLLGEPCTVFEAVVAVVWRCRTRAVISDEPRSTCLVFVSNVRRLLGAAGGYYGNCCIGDSVQATGDQVANGDTKDVVKLIKVLKDKIQNLVTNDHVVNQQQQQQLGYNTLTLSSWRNLGLEAADFGGGTPARVLWYAGMVYVPFCVLCPPSKGMDGVNVLARIVKKEHVSGFMHELAVEMQVGQ
jgi:hypothetical protein